MYDCAWPYVCACEYTCACVCVSKRAPMCARVCASLCARTRRTSIIHAALLVFTAPSHHCKHGSWESRIHRVAQGEGKGCCVCCVVGRKANSLCRAFVGTALKHSVCTGLWTWCTRTRRNRLHAHGWQPLPVALQNPRDTSSCLTTVLIELNVIFHSKRYM